LKKFLIVFISSVEMGDTSPLSKPIAGVSVEDLELEIKKTNYGFIDFSNNARRVSPYIKISNDINQELFFKQITSSWNLSQPFLLISITGGAANFPLPSNLEKFFAAGLTKAAKASCAWIITAGTNTGVMKYVGTATANQGITTIGIAPFNKILGKEEYSKNVARLLYSERSAHKGAAALETNHTNFILVDSPDNDDWGSEINFRARFERLLTQKFNIPGILLAIEAHKKNCITSYCTIFK
jgi:hypothetical protein